MQQGQEETATNLLKLVKIYGGSGKDSEKIAIASSYNNVVANHNHSPPEGKRQGTYIMMIIFFIYI